MSGEEREGFLARWSRRKRAAEREEEPPAAEAAAGTGPDGLAPDAAQDAAPGAMPGAIPGATPDAAGAPPALAAEPPACPIPNLPEVDLASLPRIEDLTADSDFSLFLRPGIPQALRNAALRRMWSLDPAIRDYIGPVDYQWDFNTPGGLPFGFSNELVGDIGKLLAQAIGQVPEKEDPPAEETAAPEGPAVPEAPVPETPVAETPLPETPDLPPPDPVRLAELVPAPQPIPGPTPGPIPGPIPGPLPEPPPVPRRRHGGALPA